MLLLHGYGGHPADLDPLASAIGERDHPVLRPEWHPRARLVEGLAETLLLLDSLSEPVHVVGHSLGGVCGFLAAHLRPDQVASLTTIASPILGAPLAHVTLGPLRDIRPGAPLLRSLPASSPGMASLHIAARGDLRVPVRSALPPGGRHEVLPYGHVSVLWARRTRELVCTLLAEVDRGTPDVS